MTKVIKFTISGQRITSEAAGISAVADSVEYLEAAFEFDEAWDGLDRVAVFSSDAGDYTVTLDADGCIVPHEVLAGSHGFSVGVIGYGDGAYRLTTDRASVYLDPSCLVKGETPAPPTPDVYAALDQRIREQGEKLRAADTQLDKKIDETSEKLSERFESGDKALDEKLDAVSKALSDKIDKGDEDLSLRLTGHVSALNGKLDKKLDKNLGSDNAEALLTVADSGEVGTVGRDIFANALTATKTGEAGKVLTIDDISPLARTLPAEIKLTSSNKHVDIFTYTDEIPTIRTPYTSSLECYEARDIEVRKPFESSFTQGLNIVYTDDAVLMTAPAGSYPNNHLALGIRRPNWRAISDPYMMETPQVVIEYRTNSRSSYLDVSARGPDECWLTTMPTIYGDLKWHTLRINLNELTGGAGVPSSNASVTLVLKPLGGGDQETAYDLRFDIRYIGFFKNYTAASYNYYNNRLVSNFVRNNLYVTEGRIWGTYRGDASTVTFPIMNYQLDNALNYKTIPRFIKPILTNGNCEQLQLNVDSRSVLRATLTGLENGKYYSWQFKQLASQTAPQTYGVDVGTSKSAKFDVKVQSGAKTLSLAASDPKATLKLTYPCDLVKTLEAMKQAIISLGGNV